MKRNTIVVIGVALLAAGCAGNAAPASHGLTHYANAQAITDRLNAAGFPVTAPVPSSVAGYVASVGGTASNVTIGEQKAGTTGINVFPNHAALQRWVDMSQSLGGVAVVGDIWAVSLPTDNGARSATVALAPKLATALGGMTAE